MIRLCPVDEFRSGKSYRSAGALRGPQRLDREIEEAVVMRNDGSANREVEIVGMKFLVRILFRAYKVLVGVHRLIVKPVCSRTMELICARPSGKQSLQPGRAAELA